MKQFILSNGKTQIEISKIRGREIYQLEFFEYLGKEKHPSNEKLEIAKVGQKVEMLSYSRASLEALIKGLSQILDYKGDDEVTFSFRAN